MPKAKSKRPVKKSTPTKRRTAAKRTRKAKTPASVFDKFLDKSAARDWLAFASMQRARLIREVRSLSEEIVSKIADAPIFANREELIRETRSQMESMIDRLNAGELLHRAIDKAKMTQHEILSFLNIPSEKELTKLQKKLNKIEARLSEIRKPRKPRSPRPSA